MTATGPIRARCDGKDRLLEADEPLAGLQRRAGGELPGTIAIPALLSLVRKVRIARLPLARTIMAMDDGQPISAWAAVAIDGHGDGEGTIVELSRWHRAGEAVLPGDPVPTDGLVRQLAEGLILLDPEQRVLACDVQASDLADLARAMSQGRGRYWTDFVKLADSGHRQPLHWRLLDDTVLHIDGSTRKWRARLFPQGAGGFELLLLPDAIDAVPYEPRSPVVPPRRETSGPGWKGLLGRDLAPALRQPVSRIVANAETIRTRLAGPLADEYSAYAADIAEAGRHLTGLIEDLADLEAVEAPDFSAAPDHIDLSDCARRAAGILSVRAKERGISLVTPSEAAAAPAIGEFRRVLQVLLNLLSNAIRYTPASSTVALSCGIDGGIAWIAVADEGSGLTQEQADRVFDKFERLGRSGDGGSGLGLYISRKLARAMGGDLTVESAPGHGARFVLSLPADRPSARSAIG